MKQAKAAVVEGFGIDSAKTERKFDRAKWGYKQQQLLSLVVAKVPEARAFLGMAPGQKLNWQYGGWSAPMISKAHECLDKFAKALPPKQSVDRGNWR